MIPIKIERLAARIYGKAAAELKANIHDSADDVERAQRNIAIGSVNAARVFYDVLEELGKDLAEHGAGVEA